MARQHLVRRAGICLLTIAALSTGTVAQLPDAGATKKSTPAVAAKPRRTRGPQTKREAAVRFLEDRTSAEHKLERAIHQKLSKRVDIDLTGQTLGDTLNHLAKVGEFELVIDPVAVAASDIILTSKLLPVKFHQTSIRAVFKFILNDGDTPLAWEIENGVLNIITQEKADSIKTARVYSIAQLLEPKTPVVFSQPQDDITVLNTVRRDAFGRPTGPIAVLLRNVTSGIWEEDDPEAGGSVNRVGKYLSLRQTQAVLYEIDELLRGLEVAARGGLKGGVYDVRDEFYDHDAEAAARKVLDRTIAVNVSDKTLADALQDLTKKTGLTFVAHAVAVRAGDITLDQEVNLKLKTTTVRAALNLLLEQHADTPLTYVLQEGVVTITTQEHADNVKRIVVYDIRDLLAHELESQMLTDAIRAQTSGIWQEDDPEAGGAVEEFAPVGVLVCRQTNKVHAEIASLLAALRTRIREEEVRKGAVGKKPVLTDETPVTRFYPFLFKERATAMQAAITKMVAPKTWAANKPDASIALVEGTLVIRHTVKVHRDIRAFLDKIDSAERLGNGPIQGIP